MNDISRIVISIAQKHFGDYRVRGDQLIAEYCPFCHGGERGDRNTFAVGLENGAYNCKRGSCNASGNLSQLLDHLNEEYPKEVNVPTMLGKKKKPVELPPEDMLQPLTEEIITYFARRMISEQTLRDWHISSDENGNIIFPFYRKGVLTYVKYRKPKKHTKEDGPKEWQMKSTEPILFGMDMVSFTKPLVITEGEIDALSVYEAGWSNVVSVPSGCDNMSWLDKGKEWLEHFPMIYLLGDSDEPGMRMVSNLVEELGKDHCMIPSAYPPLVIDGTASNKLCKDANEILYCYGPQGVIDVINQCESAPVDGILDLADVPRKNWAKVPKIYTRIPSLDNMIGGLAEGTVTILSGKRGEGKSTISGEFMLNAIDQGYNVGMYSGELDACEVREWIMLQATEARYVGYSVDEATGQRSPEISAECDKRISDWMRGHFFLYDNTIARNKPETEAVLEMFATVARRNNVKLFVIDNLMSILRSPDEENKAQARFTADVKAFALKYKVAVVMVCHPRKEKAETKFSSDSVSGSSAITNLSDLVLNIERPNIRVAKNRHKGMLGLVVCSYNPCNRRIFETSCGDRIVYGWNHDGLKLPEKAACECNEFKVQEGSVSEGGFSYAAA